MLDLIIVILCLVINAIFSAYEMAFVTLSREDIEDMDGKQVKLREKVLVFKTKPERTLSVIQIGITLVGAVAAAVGGTGAVENLEPYLVQNFNLSKTTAEAISVAVVIVPLTYFSVVFGELVPKTIALRYPERVLSFGTRIIFFIDKIFSPVVSLLERSTGFITGLLGLGKSEEEIPESVEVGNLPDYHRIFVRNLVGLRSKRALSVMVPWEKVSYLNFSETDDEVRAKIRQTHRSRFPVIDGDVLVGILHVKEWNETFHETLVPWQSILGPALSVSPEEKVLEVFLKMQEKNHHLAVVEEKGHFLGIITIEDVIEQIFGNIRDDLERNRIMRLLSARQKITLKK